MAKKGKGKGFLGAVGSFFGSIPAVKSVKKAAKSVKKKVKKAKKKLKKVVKKAKKRLKKKIGKVFTKARKLKNKLSKSKLVKKVKRAAKKVVLAGKKAVKKATKYTKAVVKKAKQYAKTAPAKAKNAAKNATKKAVVAAKPVKTGEVKTEQVKKYASPNKTRKEQEAEVEKFIEEKRKRNMEELKSIYNFFFEDIETMLSPDSTWGERAEAALFTFFKPAKLADKAKDGAKIIEDQAERIYKNIKESREARDSSKFNDYSKKEKEVLENNKNNPSDLGTPPRYGDRRISKQLYDELRDKTPSREIRKQVNEGLEDKIGQPDPALPGKKITETLHADHIVSMKNITRMEGFDKLTKEQQLEVLNNPENFIGLTETANKSKGSKSYKDWTTFKKENIQVDPKFREKMIEKEEELERKLQQQIDDFVNQNK